jgi:hypothetical protein
MLSTIVAASAPSASALRAETATCRPPCARRRASASPMPEEAPVIQTVLTPGAPGRSRHRAAAAPGGPLGSIDTPLPPGPEDAAMIYIRAGIFAILGATGLLVIFYGLYGWYKRAMSEGNPDKVEEAFKIYKNAILGTIIVAMSFGIVQIVFMLLGVTNSVFEFTFIPKSGFTVEVRDSDVGRTCYPEQKDKSSEGGTHVCIDNKWK